MWSPNNSNIDTQRLHMLHIGDYVKITSNVTILTHDYSRSVLAMYCHENIGEARMTYIGDNVFIGMGATILMGTHIGNNSIVGAGAVVSGQFPDGVVIAGVVSYAVIAGIYIMISKNKVVKDIRNMIFSMLKFQVKR